MEQTILTPAQRQTIAAVTSEPNLQSFYLSGGTALAAYYLRHRRSDDLDFFSFDKPDSVFLHDFTGRLKERLGAASMRFERLYDRNLFFFKIGDEELKIEFTHYPFRQLDAPLLSDGLRVDSLRDCAANKFIAPLDRFDPKDFVDLFFILKQRELVAVRSDAEQKFGMRIEPLFIGGEFAKVRRIAALPNMIVPLAIDELREFFMERARELAPGVLG